MSVDFDIKSNFHINLSFSVTLLRRSTEIKKIDVFKLTFDNSAYAILEGS